MLYDAYALLLDHALRPLPSWLLALLPLLIAIAGAASLDARSDDRILAIVQIISGITLSIWMLVPWYPPEVEGVMIARTMTLFAYAYVVQDWLREAWHSGLTPRWAHALVIVWLIACLAALILSPTAV